MQELNEIVSKLLKKENLTFDESYRLMNEIMSGQISEIKLASILTSLALKGESEDEIAGMAKSMQENSLRIKTDYDCLDIVGTGGDKQYTFNISTTSIAFSPPRGITYTLAVFKSGLILTSVTVILLVSKLEIFASSFKKRIPSDCLIISPTLNCLCETGFPILSAIILFFL